MSTDQPPDGQRTSVSAQIDDATKQRLNRIAYELSEPGSQVSVSQLIREAVTDYVERYETDPDRCNPQERGDYGLGDVTGAEA